MIITAIGGAAMTEFWVLAKENISGVPVLRKLAVATRKDLATDIYTAIRDSGTYEKVFLVEVIEKETGVF